MGTVYKMPDGAEQGRPSRLVRDVAASGTGRIWVAPAQGGALDTAAGPGWAAVGDAARTLDPLSGQGVLAALEHAVETADVLLGPDPAGGLDALSAQVAARHREHRRQRGEYYRHEARWPHIPFWRRRHERQQAAGE